MKIKAASWSNHPGRVQKRVLLSRKVLGRTFGVLTCAIVLVACSTNSGQPQATTSSGSLSGHDQSGWVTHRGRWLVNANGQVLMFHGVNLVLKDAPYYPSAFGFDAQYAQWLSSNGFDLVRLGVLASGEMPSPGVISSSYVGHIVDTVNLLARFHIYVLLDWHQDDYGPYFGGDGMPNWMTLTNGQPDKQFAFPLDYTFNPALQEAFQAFWNNQQVPGGKGLQDYYVEMLKAVASKVATNPWVIGYEVMNEPWPGTSWNKCTFGNGCPQLDASELDPFYARAAQAIRSVDSRHMIFLEPFVLFNFGGAPTHISIPKGITNVGLAFHQYALSASQAQQVFNNAIGWSSSTGGALLNTEWSNSSSIPGVGGLDSIEAQENLEDHNFMPFTYWVMNNCDIACSSNQYAAMFYNLKDPPTGLNVNTAVDMSLIRPEAMKLSGTPLSTNYSGTTFAYAWSPVRSSTSTRYPIGSISTFFMPKLIYPNGYSVSVSGPARVVSPPDAQVLEISQTDSGQSIGIEVLAK